MIAQLYNYARSLLSESGPPAHITLFITGRCNFKCRTCFYWRHLNRNQRELTLDEFKVLAPQLRGVLWLAIGGGEPFIRDDLGEIMEVLARETETPYMSVVTSGFFPERLEPVIYQTFSGQPALTLRVSISLDGVGKRHDYIRGKPGSFEKAVESLQILQKLKARFPRLRITVCTCYNALNQEEIEEIPEFIKKNFSDLPWDFALIRGNPMDLNTKINLDINRYFELKRKYFAWSAGVSGRWELLDRLIRAKDRLLIDLQEQIVLHKKSDIKCRAASLSAVIREQGEVMACEQKEFSLGNLKDFEFDFKKLWNSKKARETRRMIESTRCQCSHECNLTINMFFSPVTVPKILFSILFQAKK